MRLIGLLLILISTSSLSAETISIGTLSYDPPFEMLADSKNNFYGLDIDLMGEICRRLGASCQYRSLPFNSILSDTLSGKVDVSIAGITITNERKKNFLFSDPYMLSKVQLITKASSPINTLADVENKKIGCEKGTVFKNMAIQQFNHVQTIEYESQPELLVALDHGDIDLILLDQATAVYLVTNNNSLFKLVNGGIPFGLGYGILSNKAHKNLILRINKALIDMENDGTYLRLYQQYF